MTVPFWCLFIAAMLPISLSWVSGYFRQKELGEVDNKEPRVQCAQLTGPGRRAVAAQQNAWEALAMFTAAVMVAHLAGADAAKMAIAAQVFIVARLLHALFYIIDKDVLRSIAFLTSWGCTIWLFVMAV